MKPETGSPVKRLIGIFLFVFIATPCMAIEGIKVMDFDSRHVGIACEVKIKKADGRIIPVSETNGEGELVRPFDCGPNETIYFVARNHLYFVETITCPPAHEVVYLTSITYARNLLYNANVIAVAGDSGSAALAFTEAAARYYKSDPTVAAAAERLAYIEFAKVVRVGAPVEYDSGRDKFVMSAALKQAIELFQVQNGLKQSGKLDFKTLQTAATLDLNAMMFQKVAQ